MTRDDLIRRLRAALEDEQGNRYLAIQRVMDALKADASDALSALEILGPSGLRALLPADTRGPLPVSLDLRQPPRVEWTVGMLRAHLLWIGRVRHGINERLALGNTILRAAKADDELLRTVIRRLPKETRAAAEKMLGLQTLAA